MAQLSPVPKFRAVGSDGLALVGGKLYAYTAGTSTPKDTYTSYTLGTANTNPVILDARGEADVWLNGSYKLTLKDPLDVQIWSVDDVRDLTSSQTFASPTFSGTATFTGTAVTWSGNPTHSGNHTWSGNHLFNGSVTVGDAGADSFTVTPNAVTWTNNPTHSGNHTWSGAQTLSSTLTCNGAASFASTAQMTGVVNFSAIPTGKVTAASRTNTLTNGANVASATAGRESYFRIGDQVFGFGSLQVNCTAVTTITTLGIDIPIASAFAASTDANGVASSAGSGAGGRLDAQIQADAANDRLTLTFVSDGTGSTYVFSYSYGYRVL